MTERRIDLGDRVKDSISGFEGILTCRLEYLHGCVRVSVQPETLDKDGKPQEDHVFDEAQVELIEASARPGAGTQRNMPRPPGGPDRGEVVQPRDVDHRR